MQSCLLDGLLHSAVCHRLSPSVTRKCPSLFVLYVLRPQEPFCCRQTLGNPSPPHDTLCKYTKNNFVWHLRCYGSVLGGKHCSQPVTAALQPTERPECISSREPLVRKITPISWSAEQIGAQQEKRRKKEESPSTSVFSPVLSDVLLVRKGCISKCGVNKAAQL